MLWKPSLQWCPSYASQHEGFVSAVSEHYKYLKDASTWKFVVCNYVKLTWCCLQVTCLTWDASPEVAIEWHTQQQENGLTGMISEQGRETESFSPGINTVAALTNEAFYIVWLPFWGVKLSTTKLALTAWPWILRSAGKWSHFSCSSATASLGQITDFLQIKLRMKPRDIFQHYWL